MLKEKYEKEVIPEMKKKFGYKNSLAVPKIEKANINVGIGKILNSADPSNREAVIKNISSEIALICSQKPLLTKSKKAIAGFKIRKGSSSGLKVTLRKKRMYDFLDRLINIAIPRMRDFQGIKNSSIDKNGNLTIGVKEHIIFPEIQPEKSKGIFGLEITVVSNAQKRKETVELFRLLGFPIKKKE
jgi:large subunit ribosomal protein L5